MLKIKIVLVCLDLYLKVYHDNDISLFCSQCSSPSNIGTVAHGQVKHEPLLVILCLLQPGVQLVHHHGQDGDHHGAGGRVADEHGEEGGHQHEGK